MNTPTATRIYKILNLPDWTAAIALGHTQTGLDMADGYVHLSDRNKVAQTLRLHYAGQAEARLLEYYAEEFGDALRWEPSRGGELFPHLYDQLNLADARRTWILETDQGGNPVLPEDIDR